MTNDPQRPVVTVSELLRSVRDTLERRFPLLWVRGELSNLNHAASGHCYFTLKDRAAQVDCVMYRSRAQAFDASLREGMQVEAQVLISLYEPRGRFQLTVENLRPAGLGPLYERFLRLKEKLEREGVFEAAAKRPLPPYPRTIGVITSRAAAALRDVLTTLARRNPAVRIIVYPAPVQGEGAAGRIAAMLAVASARAECDVLLLVRGGGSIEDLWSFNEERVARAIRACAIPVIVGVGHETDFTIADFAADRRAPTPTAAAELATASRAELAAGLAQYLRSLTREMRRRLQYAAQALDGCTKRLVHPAERLRRSGERLTQLRTRLAFALGHRVHRCSSHLERLQASLASLDPQAVLARGYSITRNSAGEVLRDASQARDGERILSTLGRGALQSEVKKRELL
ncbi:MAG: exodeoxyribonuclease VII large subunit [Betaproteobacteria bacterium]|nr:exodeoxyribonuclease VII large subunit [Betaproteobacteria bacterium]